MRCLLQAFVPMISTLTMPGCVGLNETLALPFFPDVTVFVISGPEILTETPARVFLPLVTLTMIFWDLPLPCSAFGVTVTVAQISGDGVGFGVGGVAGTVTRVGAEAVLLLLSVSGVDVVT